MLNFCGHADSKSTERYKKWAKLLVREMSEKELDDARSSSQYEETYEAVTSELEKIPADDAVEGCRTFSGRMTSKIACDPDQPANEVVLAEINSITHIRRHCVKPAVV